MRIVTNPGSNLSDAAIDRCRIVLLPQQIVVDGAPHDTREGVTIEQIDRWVSTARAHPHVVGTTASQVVQCALEVSRDDRDLLVVMSSRKVIGSYDAALFAAKTLADRKPELRVRVCDTGVTDVGAGLACVLAAMAHQAGLDIDRAAAVVDAYRANVRFYFTLRTLEYLVKGGRASSLRAFVANVLGKRPVLGFVDGALEPVETINTRDDFAQALASRFERDLGAKRAVIVAIFHAAVPSDSSALEAALRARLNVVSCVSRVLSPSIYLHGGPGCVGAAVVPLDALGFDAGPVSL